MPNRGCNYVTVSPPTFERTQFAKADRILSDAHGPYSHDWLMARFSEGLQIRLLRAPYEGYVVFQPGKLAWRPVEDIDRAVFVHDIRIAPGPMADASRRQLWQAVNDFVQYYGYALSIALIGKGEGVIDPDVAPGRGWLKVDEAPDGTHLVARVLSGPTVLPTFPRDWQARANALGAGLTVQTTGENENLEKLATELCATLKGKISSVRHVRLETPEQARQQSVCPCSVLSVVHDGVRLGGSELRAQDILRRVMY